MSAPGRRGGGWSVDEFMTTGTHNVERLRNIVDAHGLSFGERILDFGCGVGRLTNALVEVGSEVVGVDIAQSMIDEARRLNRHPDRVGFVHYDGGRLPFADDEFDSAVSLITIQHAPPDVQVACLRELNRVVRPGGIVAVQIPSGPRELDRAAMRARIVPSTESLTIGSGEVVELDVRVTNAGNLVWPSNAQVTLGNHWLLDGRMVVRDDGRAAMPHDVEPGQTVELSLPVEAPIEPGEYELELDLLQERVVWFSQEGSEPVRVPVAVHPGRTADAQPVPQGAPDEPVMEMHPMDEGELRSLWADLGCTVVDAVPDDAAGAGYDSKTYLVRVGGDQGHRMISYAQNGEDVVLARLFDRQRTGRYVDVGASDPVDGSVTKHFYDRGWRGINIEPEPGTAEKLRQARPDDITLAVAAGDKPATVALHVVPNAAGLSTVDGELAAWYRQEGTWSTREITVEQVTLSAVLEKYPGRVDFLKIDVEGAERAVLAGTDLTRHRPRVVVVEATEPGTSIPSHGEWEPILIAAGYRCALFDGLNRFYAQADDAEALQVLAAPASTVDGFVHYTRRQDLDHTAAYGAYAHRLEGLLREAHAGRAADTVRVQELERRLAAKNRQLVEAEGRAADLQRRVDELEFGARRRAGELIEPPHPPPDKAELVKRINATPNTYHRLDMGDGLVIDGYFDMSRFLPYFHLPERMDGLRVLDVGTHTGFFAIECARRGAQVTTVDLYPDWRLPELIAAFDLPIEAYQMDLFDLDPSFGQFDVVICGTLLLHLSDPLEALRALRTVTADRLIVSTTGLEGDVSGNGAAVEFIGNPATDGDYWTYWGISPQALTKMALAAGFDEVGDVETFTIETEPGTIGVYAPQVALSAYVR